MKDCLAFQAAQYRAAKHIGEFAHYLSGLRVGDLVFFLSKKAGPDARASFIGNVQAKLARGSALKAQRAIMEAPVTVLSSRNAVSELDSTHVKHMVSRTSSTAAAKAVWISFGSINHS